MDELTSKQKEVIAKYERHLPDGIPSEILQDSNSLPTISAEVEEKFKKLKNKIAETGLPVINASLISPVYKASEKSSDKVSAINPDYKVSEKSSEGASDIFISSPPVPNKP